MTYSIKWDTLKKRAIKHFMGETDINNGLIVGASRDLAIAAIMKHNITPSSSPLCLSLIMSKKWRIRGDRLR